MRNKTCRNQTAPALPSSAFVSKMKEVTSTSSGWMTVLSLVDSEKPGPEQNIGFFNKRKTYFAHDPLQQCVVGDIVLLKALPERRSKHVKHELAEIVFKVGNVIDPITGKPCAGTRFLENLSDSENLTEADTTYLSEKLQELKVCSTDK
ncbi:28S ribosomal protein S17, mitochondrial [Pitangus sulphuratus]|nr:28S ribosomal protein S17, mitochondrial [Pitangus sulphuratus]